MAQTRIYFAYGSNLHRGQMQERCPGSVALRPFVLEGWRLVFRVWADVVPSPGDHVVGALYLVTEADVQALDRYEVVPDEYFQHVERDAEGREAFFFYRMQQAPFHPPEDWYLEVIRQGLRDWGHGEESLHRALLHC